MGLAVTESNAMGTPVVAYDINGLRDWVLDGRNGILVRDRTPESLAKCAINMLRDEELLLSYSANALEHSRQFNFDKTVEYIAARIDEVVRR